MRTQAIEPALESLGGELVFAGTLVPLSTFAGYFEQGKTLDEFLSDFPIVSRQQAVEVLETVVPFIFRPRNYPATLSFLGDAVCQITKMWRAEHVVLSRRLQLAGTWYYAALEDELELPSSETWAVEARKFWSGGRRNFDPNRVWERFPWSLQYAQSEGGPIYPPKFESTRVWRLFFPCRQL